MRKAFFLVVLTALVSLPAFAVQNITPQDAFTLVTGTAGVYIVDVRTEAEWRWVGHPGRNLLGEGAALDGKVVNISYKIDKHGVFIVNPSFLSDVSETFDPSTPLIMMCKSGGRGLAAAQALEAAGFTNIYNMTGGFEGTNNAAGYPANGGWKNAGLPYSFSTLLGYPD